MSALIDTTSCLLCVLSVCANVFANEIGSEPVICECKQIPTHTYTRTDAHMHQRIVVWWNPVGKILLDEGLSREPPTQYRPLFAIVGIQNHKLVNGPITECMCMCARGPKQTPWRTVLGKISLRCWMESQTMVLAHTHTQIYVWMRHMFTYADSCKDLQMWLNQHMNHHWYKMQLRYIVHAFYVPHTHTVASLTLEQRLHRAYT